MWRVDIDALAFEERLGLLVDREMTERDQRRLKTRLQRAKLRLSACIEDIDYRHPRGLDRASMTKLATCQWVHERHNVLIIGPTGIGKTWLACALGHKACREGLSVLICYPCHWISIGFVRLIARTYDPGGFYIGFFRLL